MAKQDTITVHLECMSCRKSDLPGVSRYSLKRNKKKHRNRLELMKYCRYERKSTMHREVK